MCFRFLVSNPSLHVSYLQLGAAISMDDDYSFKAAVAAAAGSTAGVAAAAATGTTDDIAGQAAVRADVSPSSLFL